MIVAGILLAILGFFLNFYALEAIGVAIAIIGLILWFVPVGGVRRRWY